ncbi:MAG: hypothetical protein HY553_01340 [Elusimicrobia bacterium]|nr:hypothetical protein [Elusimicrobiota bacterium]
MRQARGVGSLLAAAAAMACLEAPVCGAGDACRELRSRHCLNDRGEPDGNYLAYNSHDCQKLLHELKQSGKSETDCAAAPRKARANPETKSGTPGQVLAPALIEGTRGLATLKRAPDTKEKPDPKAGQEAPPPPSVAGSGEWEAADEAADEPVEGDPPAEPRVEPPPKKAPSGPTPAAPARLKHACFKAYETESHEAVLAALGVAPKPPDPGDYGLDPQIDCSLNQTEPTARMKQESHCRINNLRKAMKGYCEAVRNDRRANAELPIQKELIRNINISIDHEQAPDDGFAEPWLKTNGPKTIGEAYGAYKQAFEDDIKGTDRPEKNEAAADAAALDVVADSFITQSAWRGGFEEAIKARCRWPYPRKETTPQCERRLRESASADIRRQREISGFDARDVKVRRGPGAAAVLGAAAVGAGVGAYLGTRLADRDDDRKRREADKANRCLPDSEDCTKYWGCVDDREADASGCRRKYLRGACKTSGCPARDTETATQR